MIPDRSKQLRRVALLAIATGSLITGWPPSAMGQLPAGGYQIKRLGLTGAGYEYTSGGLHHFSNVEAVNNAGQTGGETERVTASGAWLGEDAWLTTGASTQVLGLAGSVYQYTGADGLFRRTDFEKLNNAGQATGESFRFTGAGDQFGALGRDAWFYNGATTQQVGFTGGVYEYAAMGGSYRFSLAYFLDDAGRASGLSNRYASDGAQTGADAWIFNGATTQLIGLTGNGYESNDGSGIRRYSRPQALNNAGQAAGISNRVTAAGIGLGVDAWRYDGATTQAIGLIGAGYDVTSPNGTAHVNQAVLINNSGQVAGYASRFSPAAGSLGYDAWQYNGATTQVVGLTGSGYEWNLPAGAYRGTLPVGLNNAGHEVGTSVRLTSAGDALGADTWIFDGTSTRRIGLSGAGYEYNDPAGVYRTSGIQSVYALNDAGQVAGVATRYNAAGIDMGQSGWFYDLATDVSTPLVFSVQTGTNYSYTEPQLVTEDGVVLGLYNKYTGAASQGRRPFWWNLSDGFHDLGDLVPGGLNAAGWTSLASVKWAAGGASNAAPQYIVGAGLVTGQPSGQSTNASAYLLTAIPGSGSTADFDGDNDVDGADLTTWRLGFGTVAGATHMQGDADGDLDVDGADFLIWQRQFGSTTSAAAGTPVPEPATAILPLSGGLVAHRSARRRRRPLATTWIALTRGRWRPMSHIR